MQLHSKGTTSGDSKTFLRSPSSACYFSTLPNIADIVNMDNAQGKRVLITGASGLMGRAVFKEFDNHPDWEVCGLAFSRATGKLVKVDLNDSKAIKQIVSEFKPSIIIHTAAKRKPDEVEKQEEATHALNVDATRSICEIALAASIPVIYISTDYVFDGTNPPYSVDAPTNPLNKYGISKLDGEKVTTEVCKGNLILRVPVLYGPVEEIGESAVTCLMSSVMRTDKDCLMSDYEVKFPTHVEDIAKVLRELSDCKLKDNSVSGVFHWSGNESLTKYQQSLIMAEVFDLPTSHLKSDKKPSGGAPRPHNPQLDTTKVEALGISHQRKFKDCIKEILEPHYKQ